MTGWAKGTTEFVATMITDKRAGSYRVNLPPPIREKLGNPTHIMFKIKDDEVVLKGVNK